jgi:uncharacterized protein (DUF1778 family)
MSGTESQDAQWLYEHRDELEGEDVDFEAVKPASVTFAFRLPPDEAKAIRDAAETAGISVSEFIREACRRTIGATQPLDRVRLRRAVEALRRDVEDLRDATG